jgi:hypothetical protein
MIAGVFMLIDGFILLLLATTTGVATLGIIVLLAAVLSIAVAWGLLKAKSWTWFPGIIQGLFVLLLGVLFTSFGSLFSAYGVLALLLGLWTIYLLTRTHVKSFLGHA